MKTIKVIFLVSLITVSPFFSGDTRLGSEPANLEDSQELDYSGEWPRKNNPIHMLVVFTRFNGQFPEVTTPPDWSERLFDGQPGSVNHYFETVSHGQIKVTGTILPDVYELPHNADYYGYSHDINTYSLHTITKIDNDHSVDFAQFDNDGPDGIPGSGDDDGYVDYLVLAPLAQPYDFIKESATGLSTLGLQTYYSTNDQNSLAQYITIDRYSGCIIHGGNFDIALGSICHEYTHSFGAYDLYDFYHVDADTESAGIGFWGIMGNGAIGWDWEGGPVMPCAYTRMIMGCVGINNENLIDIYGIHRDIRISEVSTEQGQVYRIWVDRNEYFLIEYRRNDINYYDRQIPNNGISIWHVLDHTYMTNGQEEMKRCDLECADGRYADAGYPLGKIAKAGDGRDNLDFWSREKWYADAHAGNNGDRTDIFDGVTYRNFGPYTNPNTNSAQDNRSTSIEVFNIRQDGDDMLFDINTAPFIDWSKVKFPLIGTGFNRFNLVYQDLPDVSKGVDTVYLVNYGTQRLPEELLAVSADSIVVVDVKEANDIEIQALIESFIIGDDGTIPNTLLIRKNIAPETFETIIDDYGIVTPMGKNGSSPLWVQKISTPENESARPEEIHLYQNYPNPFNESTTISYMLSKDQKVALEVFNILGQRIRTIDLGLRQAGLNSMRFDAEGLSSGVYLFRIAGDDITETRKLVYMR